MSKLGLLKSELEHRYEVALDICARMLVCDGMVVEKRPLWEGSKPGWLIGHDSKRMRFTDEDVAMVRAMLVDMVESKLWLEKK